MEKRKYTCLCSLRVFICMCNSSCILAQSISHSHKENEHAVCMLKLLVQWACPEVGRHSTRSDFSCMQSVFVATLTLLAIWFLQYDELFFLLELVLMWKVQVSQKSYCYAKN